ncbi:hypothetical protein ABK040_013679 [Willaertia magna]
MRKFNLSSVLVAKKSISSTLSSLVENNSNNIRNASTYRVKIKRNTPTKSEAKQHNRKSFLETVAIEESTPQFFEHPDFHKPNIYYLSKINMLNIGKAPGNVKKVDELTQEEWNESYKAKTIKAFEQLDLHVDLFPKQVEETNFNQELSEQLNVKLDISFAKDKEVKNYVNTVLLGNFIEVPNTLQPPKVKFEGEKGALYTLVMLTPDYPFRLIPDKGSFIHWMVTNISENDISKGDTICSYIPPLPTEYAGTFRYVFLLYKQSGKMENVEKVKELMLSSDQYKQPQQLELLKSDTELNEKMKNRLRRYAYEYEYEYIDQIIEKRFEAHSNLISIDGREEVKGSDYRPIQTPEQIAKTHEIEQRRYFDLHKLVSESKKPSGMSFFRTEYDFAVTELYQKNQWKEPFYIPPDLIHKELVKKHKIYQGISFKRQKYLNTLNWV